MTAVIMFGVLRNMAAAKDSGGGGGGSDNCAQTGCRGSSSSKSSGGGGGGGCFVAGSLVLTETNEAFPIEDISLGDVVAGGSTSTSNQYIYIARIRMRLGFEVIMSPMMMVYACAEGGVRGILLAIGLTKNRTDVTNLAPPQL